MARRTIQLDVPVAATGIGVPVDVRSWVDKVIQIGGSVDATYSVEGVLDDLLLDEFVALPNLSGLTAAAMVLVPAGVQKIRVNVTVWTSGQIEVFVSGRVIR